MKLLRQIRFVVCALIVSAFAAAAFAQGTQAPAKPFQPEVGQAGKDVVWVPTPQALVDKMLDMAQVTPQDFLMDLGSGDGRTVITAAKRGLRAQGIEYNPDMVALAQRNAAAAGMSERATFAKADLFATDFSKAQVITMFLLPQINMKLRPAILNMRPGTRIVSNSFTMEDWQPDQSETITECQSWCTAHLWIVPAKVAGAWQLPQGALTLTQQFQVVSGTLGATPISGGKLKGDEITFTVGTAVYKGRAQGNTISGTVTGGIGGAFTGTKR
ncbi:MAG: class I SAM-dependent methyltransferase [Acidobacteria bacterium]|nr:class I SAM-dependent methyltransferase [Acidobacteriota bacterium]